MRTPVAILSLSLLSTLAAGGAEVRRVVLPERLTRGNTGVEPLSPIDSAAWLALADASVPPGGLKRIEAGVPSPKGLVRIDLRFDAGRVSGTVTLPEGLSGVFAWQGAETPLTGGENRIALGDGLDRQM